MEAIKSFFDAAGGYVWGVPMLTFLVGTGVFLTIRLKLLQFTTLGFALRQAFTPHAKRADGGDHEGDVSHFGALMTALSATIGTGNIAGVATAVVAGGPGAVFWMWMTALFGMATKYAEGVLAVKYRVTNSRGEMSGGPMYYIERGLGKKWLAVLFAIFGVLASFGIGSSVQSNSVAQAIHTSFAIDTWITGVVLTVFTGLVILGGIRSISKVSSAIVPIMAVGYVLGGLVVIALHLDLLFPALQLILTDAFTGEAVAGGALGTVIRYGVARGVFSNEAGMGSAPIAAAAAKTDHPVRQALVSMTGTFLDTIIVCSITGIVLVMGGMYTGGQTGAALTTTTFNQMLPGVGGWIVTFGLVFFAYSTILGWCYYGEKCATYLVGDGGVLPYRMVYVASVMAGTVLSLDLVWSASDVFNGLMALPNLIALVLLSGVVVKETHDFFEKRRKGELP
ncbi:alanine/glycine:cation symporter family protein [Brachymonas chironomi]|uniref:alanine/glycine:cation symporter family protein n=1 Tax=Brachymonas chironomi TaxID=491919 RepID=UPI00037C7F2D|nr:sodium:alanine symporter family protein [Brachymonas chironomi]